MTDDLKLYQILVALIVRNYIITDTKGPAVLVGFLALGQLFSITIEGLLLADPGY